jgi:mono/diheme cytochrome c family protein
MLPAAWIDKLSRVAPRWSPGLFKAAAVALVLLAFAVPITVVALPFLEFFNDMAAQPKGKAQMTYGREHDPAGEGWPVERPPVEGTLPRGHVPYPFAAAGNKLEDAKAVGTQLGNPLPYTVDGMKRGQTRFARFCFPCHGSKGEGDGPVTGPNRFPSPPSLNTDQARGYADGTIFHILTKGVNKMPSYAQQLTPEERWQAILYVRALQRAMSPKPGDLENDAK